MRPSADRLQLVPQPPLPQVPGHRRRASGWRPGKPSCSPHRTFTSSSRFPAALGPIALQNPREVYGLLFGPPPRPCGRSPPTPSTSGPRSAFLAVLHTWGQNLNTTPTSIASSPAAGSRPTEPLGRRPHGVLPPGPRPQPCLPGQVPRPAPGRLRRGKLSFHGQARRAGRRRTVPRGSPPVVQTEWVVYAKPPFGGAGTGAEVPGPVHPQGGDQQPPAGRPGGRPGHVPMEGLRRTAAGKAS